MNGLKGEKLVTLKQATAYFPGRSGDGASVASTWRWILKGLRGVKLESTKILGTRYTSVEAIDRFIAATSVDSGPQQEAPRTQRRRQRDIAAAARQLDAAGVLRREEKGPRPP
jgi:hypothetical protein